MSGDFVQRGKELLVRREFADVVEVCRAGLAASPGALDGRLLLGTALLALRRYDDAVDEMRLAAAQDSSNVLVRLLLGEALLRGGDHLAAVEALAEAHALDPGNKVAARLYNEALERTHRPVADPGSPGFAAVGAPVQVAAGSPLLAGEPGGGEPRGRAQLTRDAGSRLGAESLRAASGGVASGGAASGGVASGGVASGGVASGGAAGGGGAPLGGSPSGGARPVEAAGGTPVAGSGMVHAASTPPAARARPRARRRRWPFVVAALVALVALGATAATLLVRRASRHAEAVRGRRAEATNAAGAQTYSGYLRAARIYEELASAGDDAAGAAAARLRGALAFEFGLPPVETSAPSAGARGQRDAQLAGVYRLLAGPETAGALSAAQLAASTFPDDAEAAYLAGRAAARARDPAAQVALRRSIALAPTPLAWTALGEAEAAVGHLDEALADLDAALALLPGHPSALIARALVFVALGRLPEGDDLERSLARLAEAGAEDEPLVSPAQARAAALALAEVKLTRGDASGARAVLQGLATGGPPDARLGALLVEAFLASGDLAAAEREAERWREARPELGAPHLWLARVALVRDRPDAAKAELEQAGEALESPAGLVAQAAVELAAGRADVASALVDRALALRPAERDVQVLRARTDLARGDAPAAEARLARLHEAWHDPIVGIGLGECLLARDARAQARPVLEDSVRRLEQAGVHPRLVGWGALALARIAVTEGRWGEAQRAVARSLAVVPDDVEARLLEASVRAEVGDAAAARAALDTLAVAAHADGRVLAAAARAHGLAADPGGARLLLDEAQRLGGVPRGELAEVTARVLLLEGKPGEAVTALASGGGPEGGPGALLLIDALLAAGKPEEAETAAAQLVRRFAGRPEEALATGRLQLGRKDGAGAAASFTTALQRLEAAAASPQALADARSWLGRALEAAGRADDAVAAYREALRLSPTGGTAAALLGRALVGRNDFAGAEGILLPAVKQNPGQAEPYFWLAQASRGLHKSREARQALRTYLELAPRGEQAVAAQKQLERP